MSKIKTTSLLDRAAIVLGTWQPHLTRTRLTVFGVTLIAVGLALGGLERSGPTAEATIATQQMVLELPDQPALLPEPVLLETMAADQAELQIPGKRPGPCLWRTGNR